MCKFYKLIAKKTEKDSIVSRLIGKEEDIIEVSTLAKRHDLLVNENRTRTAQDHPGPNFIFLISYISNKFSGFLPAWSVKNICRAKTIKIKRVLLAVAQRSSPHPSMLIECKLLVLGTQQNQ